MPPDRLQSGGCAVASADRPHYHRFRGHVGRLDGPEDWDAARASDARFAVAATRGQLDALATAAPYPVRAAAIAVLLEGRSCCSHGVGGGVLERALLDHAHGLALTCTDYAPRTVSALRGLLPEATIIRHDLRTDPLPAAAVHLFHRVDTDSTATLGVAYSQVSP